MKSKLIKFSALLLVSLISVMAATALFAQSSKIAGTVYDDNDAPLAGVVVMVDGTNAVTTTDADGKYTVSVPASAKTLTFSCLGMKDQTVTIGQRALIDVIMETDATMLNEAVAVGYGTMIRKELSASVASVKNEELTERASAVNVAQALAGKMAGVRSISQSGRPGGTMEVRVRGVGSINASANPLYVVDGVVDVAPEMINQSDIESIDVLKDAAATAIYGAKGANGVVLITTKAGKAGQGTVTFDSRTGVSVLHRTMDLMDSEEYMYRLEQSYAYEGEVAPHLLTPNEKLFKYQMNADGSYYYDERGRLVATPRYNTDWLKETFRNALVTTNSLSFNQGTEKTQVYASLGYQDVEGILMNTYAKKYTANLSMNSQIKEWLKLRANVAAGLDKGSGADNEGSFMNGASRMIYEMAPIIPAYYPDGTPGKWNDYYTTAEPKENPVHMLNNTFNYTTNQHLLVNMGLDFNITKDLTLTVNGSYNTRNYRNDYFANKGLNNWSDTENQASVTHQDITRWSNEDYLTYAPKFFDGKWKTNFVLGASWYYYHYESATASAANVPNENYQWHNLGTGTTLKGGTSGYDQQTMNSYYFRTNHTILDRYMFGVTLRMDGASMLGANNKYGFFPSASAAWNIAEEPFFENAKRVVDAWKLRASYGQVGNASIASYSSLATYSSGKIMFANQYQPMVQLATLPNGDLSWETSAMFDVGMDISLWNNRLQFVTDFYIKDSYDLLYNMDVPWTTGYSTSMSNIAHLRNTGFELTINSHNINKRNFKWDTDFIFSLNKTKTIDLNLPAGQYVDFNGGRCYEGEEAGRKYAYIRLGTWGLDEVEEAARYNSKPGDPKYLDVNNDGALDDINDRVDIGRSNPLCELAMTNTFQLHNFTFMLELASLLGHEIYSYTQWLTYYTPVCNAPAGLGYAAWTPENQDTKVPATRNPNRSFAQLEDQTFTHSGDFLRVRNVSLFYDFKGNVLKNSKFFKGFLLGVNVENPLLITKYAGGPDPEVGVWGMNGADWMAYPRPMTITGNLKITF